jgi:hypothetical protein
MFMMVTFHKGDLGLANQIYYRVGPAEVVGYRF